MENLSTRQEIILDLVIDAHIQSGQPIGSRYLSECTPIPDSPATIRNEMGSLEDMGYLMHKHTSSGRIPTDKGYRYYVDNCLGESGDEDFTRQSVDGNILERYEDKEECAERLTQVLSSASAEAGVVILPIFVRDRARMKVSNQLFLQGTGQLLEKPEFQDMQKIRKLFEVFEEKCELINWINDNSEEDSTAVHIGRENELEALWDCSVVSSGYVSEDSEKGSVAIIGPKRMRYDQAIPLVNRVAKILNNY